VSCYICASIVRAKHVTLLPFHRIECCISRYAVVSAVWILINCVTDCLSPPPALISVTELRPMYLYKELSWVIRCFQIKEELRFSYTNREYESRWCEYKQLHEKNCGLNVTTVVGIRCADHVTPSTRKNRHYFADSGGRSVGIIRLRTKAKEFFYVTIFYYGTHFRNPKCLGYKTWQKWSLDF
jgi:hypothetical protein